MSGEMGADPSVVNRPKMTDLAAMRIRHQYIKRNRVGSRTVVSTGPVGMTVFYFFKLAAYLIAFTLVFAWPILVIDHNMHGVAAWVLGVPSELAWLAFMAFVWTNYKRREGTQLSRTVRRRQSSRTFIDGSTTDGTPYARKPKRESN